MTSIPTILSHNASLRERIAPGFVAVFAGATSGIGLATLKVLTASLVAPRFYVIGHSKAKFTLQHLPDLTSSNAQVEIIFLEAEVSLLKDVDRVCNHILTEESHLDLLFMSPESVSLGEPQYTAENIDIIIALSYLSRMRLTANLLPLLNHDESPRVISILAGGHEKPLFIPHDQDVLLRNKENYTTTRAVNQAITLNSLAFSHLASLNPRVSFMHVYPGWVATDFLNKFLSNGGMAGKIASWMAWPVTKFAAMSPEECGQRQAFLATSDRYPSREQILSGQVEDGGAESHGGGGSGFYRVLEDGRTVGKTFLLGRIEEEEWSEKVWSLAERVFREVLAGMN
ncbi:hypothetical protein QBC35DRAFT_547566 [Podospora australis]|uniref:Dehydrogenase/reductase n=1 Tax=Podospora australis TaxID=1536484 RepID=A0AAN6WIW8_9PEZI|nr:hypothetical protein QBC35DRAFT_547566 [Podospora australis]